MNIVVHRENLQRALQLVERIAVKNATLPILGNVLLKAVGGTLRLSATNLEVGITAAIGAKISKEGSVAVPARLLTDLIRAAHADTVSLKMAANVLSATTGSSKTSILCFDPSEYPIIPTLESGTEYVIAAEQFALLCSSALDAIATSESRPELAGALFVFESGGMTVAATDSFRLVEHRTTPKPGAGHPVIVPRAAVAELVRVLNGARGDMCIRVADNQVAFSHENMELVSRLVDGRFPDYQKVIPDRSLSKTLVRRGELIDAIRVAALFSSSISDVKLSCAENILNISGKHSAKGEGTAEIEAALKGEAFDISLNYHYLLDGLKVIPTEKVVLEFTGKGSPFILRPESNTTLVYLVMPLRG